MDVARYLCAYCRPVGVLLWVTEGHAKEFSILRKENFPRHKVNPTTNNVSVLEPSSDWLSPTAINKSVSQSINQSINQSPFTGVIRKVDAPIVVKGHRIIKVQAVRVYYPTRLLSFEGKVVVGQANA